MGWWTDIAVKKTGCPNVGGPMTQQRGVVLHIAQGSYQGTISWQMNPASQVSSHFIVSKKGEITQMVDTAYTAWTQADGNGKWLSIENEGYVPDPLTDAQLDACAAILAKANAVYGVPLQVTGSPAGYGLGHHSMGAETGLEYWGHSECPGSAIKNQKQEIVDRATGETMDPNDVWYADCIDAATPPVANADYDTNPQWTARYALYAAVQASRLASADTKALRNDTAEIIDKLDCLTDGASVSRTADVSRRLDRVHTEVQYIGVVLMVLLLVLLGWVAMELLR